MKRENGQLSDGGSRATRRPTAAPATFETNGLAICTSAFRHRFRRARDKEELCLA